MQQDICRMCRSAQPLMFLIQIVGNLTPGVYKPLQRVLPRCVIATTSRDRVAYHILFLLTTPYKMLDNLAQESLHVALRVTALRIQPPP